MNLKLIANGFTSAWKASKKAVQTALNFVVVHHDQIQNVAHNLEDDAKIVVPALAPAINAFSAIEEAVMGKVMALAHNAETAPSLQELFKEEWPVILSLKDTLAGHPDVVAALAAPVDPAK